MGLTLHERVALKRDLQEHQLRAGDVAYLVDFVPHPESGEEGGVIEVFNAIGDSIAVVTVPLSELEPLAGDEVLASTTATWRSTSCDRRSAIGTWDGRRSRWSRRLAPGGLDEGVPRGLGHPSPGARATGTTVAGRRPGRYTEPASSFQERCHECRCDSRVSSPRAVRAVRDPDVER
jgi:hypothetical protein